MNNLEQGLNVSVHDNMARNVSIMQHAIKNTAMAAIELDGIDALWEDRYTEEDIFNAELVLAHMKQHSPDIQSIVHDVETKIWEVIKTVH